MDRKDGPETKNGQASVIRLEGTFDLPSARLVEHTLKRLRAGDPVRVDFSRVRHFHDYGVAVLAQALRDAEGIDVKIDGLGRHHVRLLRYFGVRSDVFRAPSSGDDAD